MTSRELEILDIIYQIGGQCSLRLISKETGLSSEYAFLIAKGLLKQKLIKKIANNVFILTAKGGSFLEHRTPPTLIAVSRGFGNKIELPAFEPETHFMSRKFMAEQPCLTEHNLDKDPTTEVADARSIQKSLKRLIFINCKRPCRWRGGSKY